MENLYSYLRMFEPSVECSVSNLHTPGRISSLKLKLKEGAPPPPIARGAIQPWPNLGLYLGDGAMFLDASVEHESVHCSQGSRGRLGDGVFILSENRFLDARLGVARILPHFLGTSGGDTHGHDIKFNIIVNFSGKSISAFREMLATEISNVCYNSSQGYKDCEFQFCFFKNVANESYYNFSNFDNINRVITTFQNSEHLDFSTGSKISLKDIDLTRDPEKINVVIVCDISQDSVGFDNDTFEDYPERIYIRSRNWDECTHPEGLRFMGRGSGSPLRDIFKMMSFYTPFFNEYSASAVDLQSLPRHYVNNLHRVHPTNIIIPPPEWNARDTVVNQGLEYSMSNVFSFWDGGRTPSTDKWILKIDGNYFSTESSSMNFDPRREHYHAVRWNSTRNQRILFCP